MSQRVIETDDGLMTVAKDHCEACGAMRGELEAAFTLVYCTITVCKKSRTGWLCSRCYRLWTGGEVDER